MMLLGLYEGAIAKGVLRRDHFQVDVLRRLEKFMECSQGRPNIFTRLLQPKSPSGIYLYGGVGSGKTMLMDMFYDSILFDAKCRQHYNSFMLNVHNEMHKLKGESAREPLSQIAKLFSKSCQTLCLDEFQVTDIADAMILKQLLAEMLKNKMRLVMTSNRHPTELYQNGIQRQSFLPCIELIMRNMEVIKLSTLKDYRQYERDKDTDSEIRVIDVFKDENVLFQIFKSLVGEMGKTISPTKIITLGREIMIPKSCSSVAYMTFQELCGTSRSAADYLAICKEFNLIFVDKVCQMDFNMREEARRFITFIDIAYDCRLPLVMNMTEKPTELFQLSINSRSNSASVRNIADELHCSESAIKNTSLITGEEEIFAKDRTISRLHEMSNPTWWNTSNRRMEILTKVLELIKDRRSIYL